MPLSAMVGTSGMLCERVAVATAIALSLPLATYGLTDAIVSMATCVCPAIRSVRAGPPPLYMMWVMLTPAIRLNSSAATCWGVPLPGVLKLIFAGFAFASATSSRTLLAAMAGWTTKSIGADATSPTGANALAESNGRFGYRNALIAIVFAPKRRV